MQKKGRPVIRMHCLPLQPVVTQTVVLDNLKINLNCMTTGT